MKRIASTIGSILPKETLYAVMLILVVSAGAEPFSLDALILGLMNKPVA